MVLNITTQSVKYINERGGSVSYSVSPPTRISPATLYIRTSTAAITIPPLLNPKIDIPFIDSSLKEHLYGKICVADL